MPLVTLNKSCDTLMDYLFKVNSGLKAVYEMTFEILVTDMSYYWSNPDGKKNLSNYTSLLEKIVEYLETKVEYESKEVTKIYTLIHKQLNYLLNLPKNLQENITSSLKKRLLKLMTIASERTASRSSRSSSQ